MAGFIGESFHFGVSVQDNRLLYDLILSAPTARF